MSTNLVLGRPLDTADIEWAAARLDVTAAHVRAVVAVEAAGAGFLPADDTGARRPKILFEAHVFGRETGGRYHDTHARLSTRNWKRSLYQGGLAEHGRLQDAAALDWVAAHRAASWGLFQIMGFNHAAAGYERLEDFVGVQHVSEGLQLGCGVRFIQSHGLDRALRDQDWRAFARGYNGRSYARHGYHERLAAAYGRFAAGPSEPDERVQAIQAALNRSGFNLAVDGIPGSRTEAAIRAFQQRTGLAADGIVGPRTAAALGLD